MKRLSAVVIAFFFLCDISTAQPLPVPAPRQLAWQQLETTAFLHFTVNTFTDKEWGEGTEDPKIFNPADFDARKIVKTLKDDPKYLNTGDPNGKLWIPAETDVSIRPGWFYHPAEDDKVKTGKQLVDLYYKSVGRNSLLLLNIPPNRQGLLSDPDVASIKEFRTILNETFLNNFAEGNANTLLTDKKLSTFITLKENEPLVIDLKKSVTFDRAMFQENIANGQKNEEALLEYWDGKEWQKINQFTTIGYKRLIRFPAVTASKVRLTILKTKQPVQISEAGFYKASDGE